MASRIAVGDSVRRTLPHGLAMRGFLCALLILPQLFASSGWCQRASSWRAYRMVDGLPDPACLSVTVGPRGNVLVRHSRKPFVSELNGYTINVIPSPGIGGARVHGSPAGQLWTAVPEGLLEFRNGTWLLHPVAQIYAASSNRADGLALDLPLCPVRQGVVLFLLPDRLAEFNCQNQVSPRTQVLRLAEQTRLKQFSDMSVARDGGLWITGPGGLARVPGPARILKPESEWREYTPPESLGIRNLLEPREDESGAVTMVGEAGGNNGRVVVRFSAGEWIKVVALPDTVRLSWRGADDICWAATADSLLEWRDSSSEPVPNEEISARAFNDMAMDTAGGFWLATSDGLYRYAPLPWRVPPGLAGSNPGVQRVSASRDNRIWYATATGLNVLDGQKHAEWRFPPEPGRSLQGIRSLYALPDGTLLLESGGRLSRFDPASGAFKLFSTPAENEESTRFRALGVFRDGGICLQSRIATGERTGLLHVCYGDTIQAFPDPPPGAYLEGDLTALLTTQAGDLWLGDEQGTMWYHERRWQRFLSSEVSGPQNPQRFVEMPEGRIWCATQDRIWEFDGRIWSDVRKGYDRIYDLLRSKDGSVWVASNGGLERFFKGAWVENGPEEGLPSLDIRAVEEDAQGRIWVGTTRGLSLYHPKADADPPETYINEPATFDRPIPEGGTINLTFAGWDKWRYTLRDRLLYSYRLDEKDWSPFSDANAGSFPDLAAGKHLFQVRAMDRNCNIDATPASLEFTVFLPWYRERRLLLIALSGLGIALFFAGLAFNRHRRLLKSYAEVERKVTERTRELEIANRELLQSQKMNALGTLAAGIAHDFNNILSIIKGSAQIIESNLDKPDKVRTRVDRIKMVVEQGAGIVKAMLGFSRGTDQSAAPLNLNEVVEETVKLLGDRFLREVQVRFEPTQGLPEVVASKDYIQQILLNLVFNAAESMARRKDVILATQRLDAVPKELVLLPGAAPLYVAVSVQDFGCGIPPENLPRIFEPFFTTKAFSARRGTGLGLSMVYELARQIQAGLAVDSVLDHGSRFTLILPVVPISQTDAQAYEDAQHSDH